MPCRAHEINFQHIIDSCGEGVVMEVEEHIVLYKETTACTTCCKFVAVTATCVITSCFPHFNCVPFEGTIAWHIVHTRACMKWDGSIHMHGEQSYGSE